MSVWRRGNEIIILGDFILSITLDSQQVVSAKLNRSLPVMLSVPFPSHTVIVIFTSSFNEVNG